MCALSDDAGAAGGPGDFDLISSRWPHAFDVVDGRPATLALLTEPALLADLFALRYRRYVVEQGKHYATGVGEAGTLVDPIDRYSLNIAQLREGKVAAAVRLSFLGDISPGEYLAPLGDALAAVHGPKCMVCSRFVIDDGLSHIKSTINLFRLTYELGLRHGGLYSALSTRRELVATFAAFGYREIGIEFDHPVSRHQVVMVLNLRDDSHLAAVNSPLLAVYRRVAGETSQSEDLLSEPIA